MFRMDYPYSSVLHECSSIIVYAWEHTGKKSLVNSTFHFMAFSVSRSFSDSLSFLSLSLLPDGVYMSGMSAWLVTDWPWSPKRTEAIFKPKPPNHCAGRLTWSAHPEWVSLGKPCAIFGLSLLYWRCHTLNLPGELLFHQILHRSHGLCARSCDPVITVMESW